MIPNPEDTIVALASAPGPGKRGIVRLSGPLVRSVVTSVYHNVPNPWPTKRSLLLGRLHLTGLHSPLPANLLFSPGPHTYTGQDTAELHLISSPPLLDLLITELMNAGARAAQPGEFTMRAFLGGKKDLPQAEAVAAVIEAGSADELQQALGQMAGGVTLPLNALRDDLLNLLADIEAGLDFSEEDITFVGKQDTLFRIGKGLAQLTNLLKQFETRSVNGKPFRVALVGEPNAGKSSLFNALAGLPAALVSPIAGTTRDYVSRTIQLGDLPIELIDSAGWQQGKDTIEKQAQALGLSQACSADLLLWCVDANRMNAVAPQETAGLKMLKVTTKADLSPGISEPLVTSTRTGQGIAFLKGHLLELARSFFRPALAPSLSRCRHHVEAALKHLRTAHGVVLHDDASELLALELRLALEQLGEMTGAIHTDDLLDRIFSRFCIGK